MARITKPPEERKKEIIETAAKIFNEQGYENTAVSDIVKSINIAQGTFYYYFKSKEDLIEPIIEHLMNKSLGEIEEIVNSDNSFEEKLRLHISNRINFGAQRMGLFAFLLNKKNGVLLEKFKKYAVPKITPIMKLFIKQAEEQGIVKVDFPEETIRIIIIIGLDLAELFFSRREKGINDISEVFEKLDAYENIFRRLLGISDENAGLFKKILLEEGSKAMMSTDKTRLSK